MGVEDGLEAPCCHVGVNQGRRQDRDAGEFVQSYRVKERATAIALLTAEE